MSQMTFSDFEYAGKRKLVRRERFLAEMDQVVPWAGLLGLLEPFYSEAGGGRKPYPFQTMLRIHLLQTGSPRVIRPWKKRFTKSLPCASSRA